MKKIFKLLLPLLVVLLIYPSIGNTKPEEFISSVEELNLILTEINPQEDARNDVILLAGRRGSRSRSRSGSSGSSWGNKSKSRPTTKSKSKSSTWGSKSKDKNISGNRNKKTPEKKKAVTKTKTKTGNKTVSKSKTKNNTSKETVSKTKTKRKLSKADKKLAAKAKKSGKYHKDRKSARSDFKKKNAKKYTSTYKTKPATRPTHIPRTTMVGGVSYNIGYNAAYGGYGYMGVGGRWMMYDMMTDIVMMDMMMNRSGYVVASEQGRMVPIRGPGWYLWNILFTMIGVIIVVAFIIAIMKKTSTDG